MYYFGSSWLILLPGLIIAAIAQAKVSKAYKTYSRVPTRTGMTGKDAARRLLDANGLTNVGIEMISGEMTDHYDPKRKVMRLSNGVGNGASLASVGIAAHETGHAIQDAKGYIPLRFRNAMVPVCNLTFYIVTLPVEFNASSRAVAALTQYGIVSPGEEMGVKKVLSAAAMTYVASTLMAFLNLVRMLAIRERR